MRLFLPSRKQSHSQREGAVSSLDPSECLFSEDDCEGDRMSLDKMWGSPGGEAVKSVPGAREMRPKDGIREGVVKASYFAEEMDSGVLVSCFCW